MLNQYISACMGIDNHQHQQCYRRTYPGYQNCNTSQISIFGGYVKVREPLYI